QAEFIGGPTPTLANPLTLGGDFAFGGDIDLIFTGNAALTGNRTITVASDGKPFLNGVVSGAFSLTKAGPGGLVLGGTNTFRGPGSRVAVAGGTLFTPTDATLGNPANTLTLGTAVLIADGTFTTTRAIVLVGGGAEIFASENANLTANGVISGAFGLIKSGVGNLVLGGANTFGGAASTVGGADGVLVMSTDANLGDPANNLAVGPGLLVSTGTFTTTRAITLASEGPIGVTAGQTLTVNGVVSGASGLIKSGEGALVLSGNNTFTGPTTVLAGTLLV